MGWMLAVLKTGCGFWTVGRQALCVVKDSFSLNSKNTEIIGLANYGVLMA